MQMTKKMTKKIPSSESSTKPSLTGSTHNPLCRGAVLEVWAALLFGERAGRSEVGEELEAEADHKVPDVACHLGAGDEDAPDEDQQGGVEGVADVPQPEKYGGRERERERRKKD